MRADFAIMAFDQPEGGEEQWCDDQRGCVVAYVEREGLEHGEVGEWPAWHVYPHVAIWAVESLRSPGWVGWWAISGDLPTDYMSCGPMRHPREGMRDIALRWREAAKNWSQGRRADGWSIGTPENERELAPLLAKRAELLLGFADDDSLWED